MQIVLGSEWLKRKEIPGKIRVLMALTNEYLGVGKGGVNELAEATDLAVRMIYKYRSELVRDGRVKKVKFEGTTFYYAVDLSAEDIFNV